MSTVRTRAGYAGSGCAALVAVLLSAGWGSALATPISTGCGDASSDLGESCSLAELLAPGSGAGIEIVDTLSFTNWSVGFAFGSEPTDFSRILVEVIGEGSNEPGLRFADSDPISAPEWFAAAGREVFFDGIDFDVIGLEGTLLSGATLAVDAVVSRVPTQGDALVGVDVSGAVPAFALAQDVPGLLSPSLSSSFAPVGGLSGVGATVVVFAGGSETAQLRSFDLGFQIASATAPEPGTFALLALGVFGVGVVTRRRAARRGAQGLATV